MISIRRCAQADIQILYELISKLGYAKDEGYFERCFAEQDQGSREIFIIAIDGNDAGYGQLDWQPRYSLFKKLGVPEIQDLNVLPEYRRRGIASALITHCEEMATAKGCEMMGISVGLTSAYGAAQRLYVKLGYVPDGYGVTYDRAAVTHGQLKPVDDDLCLMMLKDLV